MFVNGSNVFAPEQGAFTDLVAAIFGRVTTDLVQLCSALVIIVISGSYALWLWKKAE